MSIICFLYLEIFIFIIQVLTYIILTCLQYYPGQNLDFEIIVKPSKIQFNIGKITSKLTHFEN